MSTIINGYSPNSYMNINANYGNNFALSNYTSMNNTSGSIFGSNINTNYNTGIYNQTSMPQQDDGSAGMLQMLMQLIIGLVAQKTTGNKGATLEKTVINEGDTIVNNDTTAAPAAAAKKENTAGRAAKAAATGGLSEIFHF